MAHNQQLLQATISPPGSATAFPNSLKTSRKSLVPQGQNEGLIASCKLSHITVDGDELNKLPSTEVEKSLEIVSTLGHGSMGLVDEVKGPNIEKSSFVRKRVFLPPSPSRRTQILKIVKEEAKVVEGLSHTHIVHILATYEHTPKSGMPSFSLLMYPVGDGDLTQYLHNTIEKDRVNKIFRRVEVKSEVAGALRLTNWFSCLTSALAYIHAHGIRHQDIKPSNIVHLKEHIFFTDFSSSSRFEPGLTTSTENPARASARYSAPEILDRLDQNDIVKRHGTGSDIFALGCVFLEMLTVISGRTLEELEQHMQEAKSSRLFRFKRQASQPRAGFCYGLVISRAKSFFKESTPLYHVAPSPSPFRNGDEATFFEVVIAPMLRVDRKRRPSALEVTKTITEANMTPSCECRHAYLPKPRESSEHSTQEVQPAVVPARSGTTSKNLLAFKDYHSNDKIKVGDFVSVLRKNKPRARNEFVLEHGEMLLVVSIWDDGWATGTRIATRAEDFNYIHIQRKSDPLCTGEIKAFPLVCACLPQHWRKIVEGVEGDEVEPGETSAIGVAL